MTAIDKHREKDQALSKQADQERVQNLGSRRPVTRPLQSLSPPIEAAGLLLAQPAQIPPLQQRVSIWERGTWAPPVPYVTKRGYEAVHTKSVRDANAVVVIVCEPIQDVAGSINRQMTFARHVQAAANDPRLERRPEQLVLVQCTSMQYRMTVKQDFRFVITTSTYDEEVAKKLAVVMLRRRPAVSLRATLPSDVHFNH